MFFFFNDTATTEIYTLSLHDALPISEQHVQVGRLPRIDRAAAGCQQRQVLLRLAHPRPWRRSEEHTSELQSRLHLVCRLLLEKKKQLITSRYNGIINGRLIRDLKSST